MSRPAAGTLERPVRPPTHGGAAPQVPATQPSVERRPGEAGLVVAIVALLVAACLPLSRVFFDGGYLPAALAAAVLSVVASWAGRRLAAGPVATLVASAAAWLVFATLAFARATAAAGLLPTPGSLAELGALWSRGIQLIRLSPAPVFAEPELLLVTVTGVWAVAHAVEGLVFRLDAPVKAVVMALVLWTVPLALAPPGPAVGWLAVPVLAASAALLLAFSGVDLARWGRWVDPWTGRAAISARSRAARGWSGNPLAPAGAVLATVAILAGVLLGDRLPGTGDVPWYQLRGLGGTTLTTNPIVNIRSSLVAQDTGAVLRVRASRPTYLRVTSLDVYNEDEEWTNSGIDGTALPPSGAVRPEVSIGPAQTVSAEVEVIDLPGAVLVPMPYQPLAVMGPASADFRYDARLSTVTLEDGSTLQDGDRYAVYAAVPAPTPEQLDVATAVSEAGRLTALPEGVPDAVGELARRIVTEAGATTPFRQALAIQSELRSWTYSLNPPRGHGGRAMEAFLESRTGYCEQFAGTMAVMLRALGVPARVAVGFTPGRLVDAAAGEYVITDANAHAWVEVLFPGYGWIAFEPTPRSDGNVLVPTAANLAPTTTVSDPAALGPAGSTAPNPGDFLSQADQSQLERLQVDPNATTPGSASGGAGDGAGGRLPVPLPVVGLAALGLALGSALLLVGRGNAAATAAERTLRARDEIARLGAGLGVPQGDSETDQEYLGRLAPGSVAAAVLARYAAQARYAPALPDEGAAAAESAAAVLRRELLAGLSVPQRLLAPAAASLRALRRTSRAQVLRARVLGGQVLGGQVLGGQVLGSSRPRRSSR